MKQAIPGRIIIYSKDVENIIGRKPRTCRAILRKARKYYNKNRADLITIRGFCEFMRIQEELVKDCMMD